MKTSAFLTTLLFSAAFAQNAQVPLKEKAAGWFDKAKSYIPSASPVFADAGAAAAAAAASVTIKKVQKINIRNYKRLLTPKVEGEEEWLVYLTGGNTSCFGRCGPVDLAWNESVPLLSALPEPAGSPALQLGLIDCEKDAVLCSGWAASCPSIYHFKFPQAVPDAPKPLSPLRVADLNVTTATVQDIVRLASRAPNSRIDEVPEYNGAFHPVDGTLAMFGVQEYLGWFIWAMGSTPSWMIMIFVSFISRQFMSRRVANRPDVYSAPGAGGAGSQGAAPARGAAPAAAKPATPGSAGKGGKKRR